MRQRTVDSHPVLYVADFGVITASGGTATQQVNFSHTGILRGITFAAQDSTGVTTNNPPGTFLINIYRQNQAGLVTEEVIASTICADATTVNPYTLPRWAVGDFHINNLDQLIVTLTNQGGTATAKVSVVLWLEAESL